MFKILSKIQRFYPGILLILILSFIITTGVTCSNPVKIASLNNNLSTLKIVQLSDVHFDSHGKNGSKRLYGSSKALLEDAISQINAIKDVDLVVFSGDSINKPIESDMVKFAAMANKLEVPWYLSTGNHEIGIGGGLNKSRWVNVIRKNNKNFTGENTYYSIKPKAGYLLVFLDGVIDNEVTANGFFSRRQLDWLDNQLSENKNSKAIIIQHFPVVAPSKSSDHGVRNSAEYFSVLNKHKNVIAVLSGHYHAAKLTKVGNIVHVSTPALVQYPHSFRIITIKNNNGKVEMDFEFKPTGLKNLRSNKSKSLKLHQKESDDGNKVFVLDKSA